MHRIPPASLFFVLELLSAAESARLKHDVAISTAGNIHHAKLDRQCGSSWLRSWPRRHDRHDDRNIIVGAMVEIPFVAMSETRSSRCG
jgi:hypothetical protein